MKTTHSRIEMKFAEAKDIPWINRRYDEIGFVHSDIQKEMIAIAFVEGEPAGLGRVVKLCDQVAELGGMYVFPQHRGQGIADQIVRFLLAESRFELMYCLPFAHLKPFYEKLGFRDLSPHERDLVPLAISKKLDWCRRSYESKALLMCRTLSEKSCPL